MMRRCLQLARNGAGAVAPNPMVGAVLAQEGRVLAEGWHHVVGGPHAEVECLRNFGDGPLPTDAVLHVNLEPCAHHGRTPPCADLLIARGVKRLVVGIEDPNPLTNGKGIARVREAGMEVTTGVLRGECRWLDRRFLCRFEQGRPYVILKWARSADGFLDDHGRPARISSPDTDIRVHQWRAMEQAILVGGRTVMNDDPLLTTRLVDGHSPVRIVMDRRGMVPASARVFNDAAPTLLVTQNEHGPIKDRRIVHTAGSTLEGSIKELLHEELGSGTFMSRFDLPPITSILVEGGATILSAFIASGLWDEARVITGARSLHGGTPAPRIDRPAVRSGMSGDDRIDFFVNGCIPADSWAW